MLRVLLALILTCTIVAQALFAHTEAEHQSAPAGEDTTSRLRQMQPGSYIEVQFENGKKARGYFTPSGSSEFMLKKESAGTAGGRRFAYRDVRDVRSVQPTHTPPVAWIAAGAIVGAVVIALAVYLKFRSNE